MGLGSSRSRRASASSRRSAMAAVDVTGQLGEKGMENYTDVVIQSLWHIESFRERFIRLAHHQHQRNGLIHDYVGVVPRADAATAAAPLPHLRQQSSDDELAFISDAETAEARRASGLPPSPSSAQPLAEPLDDRETCVCCALRLIFVHYEHSDAAIIPPTTLRVALSLLLDNRGGSKFRLKEMSDAEEALDEILKYLHWDHIGGAAAPLPSAPAPASSPPSASHTEESALSRSLDVACSPACVSHRAFGLQLMDQKNCSVCRASSDPELSGNFLYRTYAAELVATKQKHRDWTFEQLLKHSYLAQNYSCPSPEKTRRGSDGRLVPSPLAQCSGPAKLERWALSLPEVFALQCVWADAEAERSDIASLYSLIPMQLRVDQFLRVQPAGESGAGTDRTPPADPDAYSYGFRGMILYYGRHYLAVFWSMSFNSFVLFDDKRVSNLGTWAQVVERCVKGKLQPTVIFYETRSKALKQKLADEIHQADEADRLRAEHDRAEAAMANIAASPSRPAAANATMATLPLSTKPQAVAAAPIATPVTPAVPSPAGAPSPITAANSFFGTQSRGEHIISAPSAQPSAPATRAAPVSAGSSGLGASPTPAPARSPAPASSPVPAAAPSSSSSSCSGGVSIPVTRGPAPALFSEERTVRVPPAMIPSYFQPPAVRHHDSDGDSSDDDNGWTSSFWADDEISSARSGTAPVMHPQGSLSSAGGGGTGASPGGVSFGFASPSASARSVQTSQQAREWICLGCTRFYPANVPFGSCPSCTQAGQQQGGSRLQQVLAQQAAQQQEAASIARTSRR